MRLVDILSEHRVTIRMPATDKPSAVRHLAGLFQESVDGIETAQITRVFEEREALASTGVGSGVAIPHGRLDGVERLMAAIAFSPDGVDFDSIDGQPVHIFVALLGPRNLDHLKALAGFSRMLRSEEVRQDLLRSISAEDALHRIRLADGS